MATEKHTAPVEAQPSQPSLVDDSNRTDAHLRAFLASMRPMRGAEYPSDLLERQRRGRSLIERLALSAHDDNDPELTLAPAECADVLAYLASVEPVDPEEWWQDPDDGPSHNMGWYAVIGALESSLREVSAAPTAATRADMNSRLISDTHDALTDELGVLRLLVRALDNVFVPSAAPGAADDSAEDIAVVAAQLGLLMERLKVVRAALDIREALCVSGAPAAATATSATSATDARVPV